MNQFDWGVRTGIGINLSSSLATQPHVTLNILPPGILGTYYLGSTGVRCAGRLGTAGSSTRAPCPACRRKELSCGSGCAMLSIGGTRAFHSGQLVCHSECGCWRVSGDSRNSYIKVLSREYQQLHSSINL